MDSKKILIPKNLNQAGHVIHVTKAPIISKPTPKYLTANQHVTLQSLVLITVENHSFSTATKHDDA